MLPIEKEPHFPDYFKDNQADSPGGNVVFPPVKTEVKNCQDGSFLLQKKIFPPHFSSKTFDGKDIALMYWQSLWLFKTKREETFLWFLPSLIPFVWLFFITPYCRPSPSKKPCFLNCIFSSGSRNQSHPFDIFSPPYSKNNDIFTCCIFGSCFLC